MTAAGSLQIMMFSKALQNFEKDILRKKICSKIVSIENSYRNHHSNEIQINWMVL